MAIDSIVETAGSIVEKSTVAVAVAEELLERDLVPLDVTSFVAV